MNEALFKSDRQDWETPQDLFDALNREFRFDIVAHFALSGKGERRFLSSLTERVSASEIR